MKKLILCVTVLLCAACTTVQKSTRVSTSLRAQEYNSIGAQYMERPTFVSIEQLSDGKTVLMVHMDTYGVSHAYDSLKLSPGNADALRFTELRFLKESVPAYVAAIDKYLSWAALAMERKDAFTKDIGRVPTWGNGSTVFLKFTFHSGNDHAHFLAVAMTTPLVTLDDDAQYFDVRNAAELKRLLLAFGAGTLQKTDIDSVYK